MSSQTHILSSPDAHPYRWLTLHPDGTAQFGKMKPTRSPSILYEHWRPGPLGQGSGFEMEHLVTGAVERFCYDPQQKQWSRELQTVDMDRFKVPQNGALLQADGTIKLLHNQSVHPPGKAFQERHGVTGRSFIQTSGSQPLFRIQQDQGLCWEYAYIGRLWHRVLPYRPATAREFVPVKTKDKTAQAVLAPVLEMMPQSGELQRGPVTLYCDGSLLFGETLYLPSNSIVRHEHLDFIATRRGGLRRLLRIERKQARDEGNFPLLFRHEGHEWYRYVQRPPTFFNRFSQHLDDAFRPLGAVIDYVQLICFTVAVWLWLMVVLFLLGFVLFSGLFY